MSKLSFPFNRNQILLLLAIGAICYNSYLHFTSPAYRYYRQSVSSLRSDFDKYKSLIESEFLPSVYFLATNSNHTVSSSSVVPIRDSNGSLGIVDGSFFICQGRNGFVFNGFSFYVGDDFFGYPIIGISPTLITTSQGIFYLQKPPYFQKTQSDEK